MFFEKTFLGQSNFSKGSVNNLGNLGMDQQLR